MPKPWTRFERMTHARQKEGEALRPIENVIYRNSRYQVHVEEQASGVTYLSIKNNDRTARHDWRDFQRIKNELCGEEREAIEIYPAESRLHDTVNQFHLYVLPDGASVPFGYVNRYVAEVNDADFGSQRRFEKKPTDLLTLEELNAASGEENERVT